MTTLDALKNLAAILCGVEVTAVTGTTTPEVIAYITANYVTPAAPTTAGTYNLVVDSEGAATWTEVI